MKQRENPSQSGTRRGKRQPARVAEPSRPGSISVATYHIHDLVAVKEMVATLHPKLKRKRPDSGGHRDGGISRGKSARDRAHGPLYLADDDHLLFVAPPGRLTTTVRKAIERELGDAVEHVQTRVFEVPKAAGAAGPSPPTVRATARPRRKTAKKRA